MDPIVLNNKNKNSTALLVMGVCFCLVDISCNWNYSSDSYDICNFFLSQCHFVSCNWNYFL